MAGYLGATPVPQATQHRESFTATAAQTTFATAGYTVGFLDVYLNGVHLTPADVTATNGSDVVLGACLVNDIVDVISHSAFELNAQTFTGDFTVDGTTLAVDSTNNRVGIGTVSPNSNLHVSATSPHIDLGPDGSNLAKIGHHANDLYLGTTSGTGEFFFKKNVSSTDGPHSSGTLVMAIDGTGAITKPLQPAFLAQVASAQSNLANYSNVVIFGTEIFDQNADFNPSNGIFTAPVTGRYMLSTFIGLDQIPATGTGVLQLQIVASNRTVYAAFDPVVFDATSTKYTFTQSLLLDMDASDTAKVQVYMPVSSSTVDINTASWFSGYLVA